MYNGRVAQDFHAAFEVGDDDRHIGMLDADGVAFAAIQGLHKSVREKDERICELESRITALEQLIHDRLPNPPLESE